MRPASIALVLAVLLGGPWGAASAIAGGRGRSRPAAAAKKPTRSVTPRVRTSPKLRSPRVMAPKNLGRLAKLDGLVIGQKLALTDPTTGRIDRKATLVELGTDPHSRVPFAWVRFTNGGEMRFAAEGLQLAGRPLALQRRYISEQRARISAAIERRLGVSLGSARVVSLRGRNVGPRNRKRARGPVLGPFLRAWNQPLGPDQAIVGFHRGGRVFLSRHYGAFDPPTIVHELIHVLSEGSLYAMQAHGIELVAEGLTELFTYDVVGPEYGAKPEPGGAYHNEMRFAEHIASTLGRQRARDLFFSRGERPLEAMARAYDKAVGKPGAFMLRARAIQTGADFATVIAD